MYIEMSRANRMMAAQIHFVKFVLMQKAYEYNFALPNLIFLVQTTFQNLKILMGSRSYKNFIKACQFECY